MVGTYSTLKSNVHCLNSDKKFFAFPFLSVGIRHLGRLPTTFPIESWSEVPSCNFIYIYTLCDYIELTICPLIGPSKTLIIIVIELYERQLQASGCVLCTY